MNKKIGLEKIETMAFFMYYKGGRSVSLSALSQNSYLLILILVERQTDTL